MKWLSKGSYEKINCGNCGKTQRKIGESDHHSGICPNCNILCVWYYISNENVIQIIPQFAPDSIKLFINWCQSELDELEMVELIVELERIGSLNSN